MDTVEMVVMISEEPKSAHEALTELKRLEQAGWIELTYYALIDKDAAGQIHIHEASDPVEKVSLAAAEGLAGGLIGCLFGPVGAAVGAVAGADLGSRIPSEAAQACPDGNVETVRESLQPGQSALLVVLEERYAERAREELETKGRTFRQHLQREERQAALRASIERVKTNVRWLEDMLRGELSKAERAAGLEKEKFEATIAAGRAELGAERESLHARLKALAAELDADLQATRKKLNGNGTHDRVDLEWHIDALESAIADCGQDLALSILDHMDSLAAHTLDLQAKAAGAGAEAAKAIEGQLHELEVRMRKHRAELTATLGTYAIRARQCIDQLRVEAALGQSEMRRALDEHIRKLDERHAVLKADLRRLEKEDTRVWQEHAAGFRQSWRALCETVDNAKRQYR